MSEHGERFLTRDFRNELDAYIERPEPEELFVEEELLVPTDDEPVDFDDDYDPWLDDEDDDDNWWEDEDDEDYWDDDYDEDYYDDEEEFVEEDADDVL